jgi:isoleucyl-tRNA synthetase
VATRFRQGKNSSIHLESFPNIPSQWKNENLFQKWNKLKTIRNVTNAAIEIKRSSKEIGSSLEAHVQIYLDKEYLNKGINIDTYSVYIFNQIKLIASLSNNKQLSKSTLREMVDLIMSPLLPN